MSELATTEAPGRKTRRREPVDVRLTVVVNFGDEPDDKVTVVDDRELVMVNSIFRYRDQIARFMTVTLLRAAMSQPRVASRLLPGLALLAGRKKRD